MLEVVELMPLAIPCKIGRCCGDLLDDVEGIEEPAPDARAALCVVRQQRDAFLAALGLDL